MTLAAGPGTADEVVVDSVRHRFQGFEALRGVSLTVNPGEFLTLLGPSGSGKTTLLRIIGGLIQPTEGRVLIAGRDVTRMPPEKRNSGFVFQNYALFPHLTVLENVAFPLRVRNVKKAVIREKVDAALALVRLSGLEKRHPAELSGGQQQRVALARAVVFGPRVLLMDEPLGSLDKRLRRQLQMELRRLQRELGVTTIYVTHDQEEAFTMSDRIAIVDRGLILQLGTPSEIYWSPVNQFIADFVGDVNEWKGKLVSVDHGLGVLLTEDGLEAELCLNGMVPGTTALACGIRPERVRVGKELEAENKFRAKILTVTFNGSYLLLDVVLATGRRLTAELRGAADFTLEEGDDIWVGWNRKDMLVFQDKDPDR